ncbi:MAG: aconitate hydratase AcnA [Gammaproteobacteria bacterium]|nr:aconitate hydratase AcnA [Gammaproteobacteria bacterium]
MKTENIGNLELDGRSYRYFDITSLGSNAVARLPFCRKILLENLLRNAGGGAPADGLAEALSGEAELEFRPARVILQDFTGVPAVVDLAAMRDAMEELGGDPEAINPLAPAELVVDHSVQVDHYASADALARNNQLEFERNRERYAFLRWGQQAFRQLKVVPPNTGIVHQVNLERLARVVFRAGEPGNETLYPDTLVGTDSHTTMVNALGVLGWGVGGIEAEAALLGQPITMLPPPVLGVRLHGRLRPAATATDLVLTVTEALRERGVVSWFIEFFGEGLSGLPLADRATLANMSPEFGSTCAIFPIDAETIRYLELTGRDKRQIALVEAYAQAQGLWRTDQGPEPAFDDTLDIDLDAVVPSIAGPKRPQDRIPLTRSKASFAAALKERDEPAVAFDDGQPGDGAVLIAAITSCTNTSNPSVMMAAGMLARAARERGLRPPGWVKTSLAPGSRVVTRYLESAGVLGDLAALGFEIVGYGCTTCIGNSGPLREDIARRVQETGLGGCSVLSGNRNFEGRIHPLVYFNYLASPPLVVAWALAGRMDLDLERDPLGRDSVGRPVYLRDIWPDPAAVQAEVARHVQAGQFERGYAGVFDGDERWNALDSPESKRYPWDGESTYVRRPPFFESMPARPGEPQAVKSARALALLGDSVTTDHISPAGAIAAKSPAGQWLSEQGIKPADYNSYGSRRGNHEVMLRGTFANIRLRNRLAGGVDGGWTRMQPEGELLSIYDAAMRYRERNTPLVVLAGKEYGSGSSRDWAAKGPALMGVRAVIASSFERIHRSNLVGMGVHPLEFPDGANAAELGLDGSESYDIGAPNGAEVKVCATRADGSKVEFAARSRIDTPKEREYFRHGGILPYVLRRLASPAD